MHWEVEDVAHPLLLLRILLRIQLYDASRQRLTDMPPFTFHNAQKLHHCLINAKLYPGLRITVEDYLKLI